MLAIDFIQKYRIKGEITEGPNRSEDDEQWKHYAMRVRLSFVTASGDERVIAVPFMIGTGYDLPVFVGDIDKVPDESLSEVVDSYAGNLRCREQSLDDYLSDFIPDVEEITVREYRNHERMWRSVVQSGRDIAEWLEDEQMISDMEEVTE